MENQLTTTDQLSQRLVMSSMNITPGRATVLPIEVESILTYDSIASPSQWRDRLVSAGVTDFDGLRKAINNSQIPADYTERKHLLQGLWEAMPKGEATSATKSTAWLLSAVRLTEDVPSDILRFTIDEAQRTCKFLPTVAEIRGIVDPIIRRRRQCAARLKEIIEAPPTQMLEAEQEATNPDELAAILEAEWPGHGTQELKTIGLREEFRTASSALKIPNKAEDYAEWFKNWQIKGAVE